MPAIRVCFSTWNITTAIASYAGALDVRLSPHSAVHLPYLPYPQAFSERKKIPPTNNKEVKRRHSEAALRPWVMRNDSHLRSVFKRAATIARVVIRLKSLVANKPKSVHDVDGPPTPRPRCGSCFCLYELLNSPLVVRSLFSVPKLPIDRSPCRCRSLYQRALSTKTRGMIAKGKERECLRYVFFARL